jgi:chitosanase
MALISALASGCSGASDDTGGSPATGGTSGVAGGSTGGSSTSGGGSNTAGSNTGGSNTAGSNTGGSNAGGSNTGGSSVGGSSGNSSAGASVGGSSGSGAGGASGSGAGGASGSGAGGASGGAGGATSCTYKDDASFCACLGNFNCGGETVKDSTGTFHSVYCGGCGDTQLCETSSANVFIGQCGGTNPFTYPWQWDKTQALVSLGENDNPTPSQNYGYAQNIKDGRGYTIGKVGFCTGTGDFVIVAACYNLAKPGNVLQKYWPGLTYYADQYFTLMANQSATTKIDALGNFVADVATAAKDPLFTGCQDAVASSEYVAPAANHFTQLHMTGALSLGFLYDTELNFGEDDDPTVNGVAGTPGTATMIAKATADYGAGMPTDFTGKIWEESRFLGFLIQERAVAMSKDKTWKGDVDQIATWEVARRQSTAKTNSPESATDLSMLADITSAYKAGYKTPKPCWTDPPLGSTVDAQSAVYTLGLNKSNADKSKWTVVATEGSNYLACPANPTP